MRKPIIAKPPKIITENGEKPLSELTEKEYSALKKSAAKAISEALSNYYSDLQYKK